MIIKTRTYVDNVLQSTVSSNNYETLLSYIWSNINTNREDIELRLSTFWTDKDNFGNNSCKFYKLLMYQYCLLYCGMMSMDYIRYGETGFDYYDDKYDITVMNEKFNCNNISLSGIFNSFTNLSANFNIFNI